MVQGAEDQDCAGGLVEDHLAGAAADERPSAVSVSVDVVVRGEYEDQDGAGGLVEDHLAGSPPTSVQVPFPYR